jgi:hypothetical protein
MPFSPRICDFEPVLCRFGFDFMSKRSGPETGRRRAGDGPETGRRWAGDGPETGRRLAGDGAIPGIGLDVGLSNRIHPDKEARSSGVGSPRARSKTKCGLYDCDPILWNSYPTSIEPQRARYIFL